MAHSLIPHRMILLTDEIVHRRSHVTFRYATIQPPDHQFNVSRCFRWGDAGFCPFNLFFTRGVSFPQYLMRSARVSTRSVRSRFNIKYNNRMMGYNWNELDQTSYDLNRWCRIRLTKYAARPALYTPNTAPTTRDGLGWPRRTAPPPEYDKCHQYSY